MTFQLASVNKQFNTASESFQTSFRLTHKQDLLFSHEFDSGDSSAVLVGKDAINIKNHFFTTGEELTYEAFDGRPIGIDHNSSGIGAATTLPSPVFCIKLSENRFKLAATRDLAIANDPIGLTTVGVGTTQSFTSQNPDTRCIVTIDNVIQSPLLENTNVSTTLKSTMFNREARFTDVNKFKNYDLIKMGNEIMRIQVIGFGTMPDNVLVDRAWMGTQEEAHLVNDPVNLVRGDYNIRKNKIHFADTPFGGTRQTIGIQSSAVNVSASRFTALTEVFSTGTQVKLRSSIAPPAPLVGNSDYFIIKNGNNDFSFAKDKPSALTGVGITLTSAGIGTHNLLVADVVDGSEFQGRAFTRGDYRSNAILDDISNNFTGVGKTFTLTSNGSNVTGINTDFGVILINNVFQKPGIDYNYVEVGGATSITFTGNDIPGQTETYSTSDVNANRLPRKGIISGLGNTQGFGYQQLQTGFGTAVVSGFGTITVAMGFTGGGYRSDSTQFKVRVVGGNPTTSAAGTFSVQDGRIKKVFMDGTPGVGYTHTNVPLLEFDSPYAYDDIKLISGSTGIGASVSIKIGLGDSISEPLITNAGYGYTVGEVLTIAGIPTNFSAGTNFQPATFTVTKTSDDKFSAWALGKFQILDNFSNEFNSSKSQFTLRENGEPISIEKTSGSPIGLDHVLLIFINDVLQKPGKAYTFDGGTQIRFTEPPPTGASLQVLFYRGTDADVVTVEAVETILKGDTITIQSPSKDRSILKQDSRVIREVVTRDTLQTTIYKGQGITADKSILRPVTWRKQEDDKFVDGVKVSKARGLYVGRVLPATRIISGVGTTSTVMYGQSGIIGFTKTEDPNVTEFAIKIVDTDKDNSGFGTTTFTNPYKSIEGVTMEGDQGVIVGVGSTSTGLQFEFSIPSNSVLRDNDFGGLTETGIGTGDFFLVSRSNVGDGVTAKSSDGSTTVGMTTICVDGVFQVSNIERVGAGSTIRVFTEIASGHGVNVTGLSSGAGNFYGAYSYAKFTTGAVGMAFTVNPMNGLTGLSTAPQIQRSSILSLDYT
jgi:hypothetical protein